MYGVLAVVERRRFETSGIGIETHSHVTPFQRLDGRVQDVAVRIRHVVELLTRGAAITPRFPHVLHEFVVARFAIVVVVVVVAIGILIEDILSPVTIPMMFEQLFGPII
jgi:hypothetical protein